MLSGLILNPIEQSGMSMSERNTLVNLKPQDRPRAVDVLRILVEILSLTHAPTAPLELRVSGDLLPSMYSKGLIARSHHQILHAAGLCRIGESQLL